MEIRTEPFQNLSIQTKGQPLPHFRSEMCTRLVERYRTQKSLKIRHLGTMARLCWAISLQLRHALTIRKKVVKQQYLLHMSSQYVELGPRGAEVVLLVWGTPTNFNGFSHLFLLLQQHAQRKPTKLCTMFGRLVGWYTTYTRWRLLPPHGILPGVITLRPSLAFSCIDSVTARHSGSWRQPHCGAGQGRAMRNFCSSFAPPMFGRAAIMLGICPHSSCPLY